MAILALISANVVSNVIIGEAVDFPGSVDVTATVPRPSIGWTYNGSVFTAPAQPAPVPIDGVQQAALLGRMTAAELHAWYRAFQRASATDSPVTADRNALYAWLRWSNMGGTVSLSSADIQGLKSVWVALGMTQARADTILTPLLP